MSKEKGIQLNPNEIISMYSQKLAQLAHENIVLEAQVNELSKQLHALAQANAPKEDIQKEGE